MKRDLTAQRQHSLKNNEGKLKEAGWTLNCNSQLGSARVPPTEDFA